VSSPKEIEIKLQLPSVDAAGLAALPLLRRADGSKQSEQQLSVYFDTKRLKLKRHGLTLRVRHVGDRYVQTVKSEDGSLFERGEWETEIENGRPDLKRANGSPLERLGLKLEKVTAPAEYLVIDSAERPRPDPPTPIASDGRGFGGASQTPGRATGAGR